MCVFYIIQEKIFAEVRNVFIWMGYFCFDQK